MPLRTALFPIPAAEVLNNALVTDIFRNFLGFNHADTLALGITVPCGLKDPNYLKCFT
jgi:hypothetical protein